MFITALSLQLPKAYAASITCGCSVTEMLVKAVLMIGESVKNIRPTSRGAICVDTIVRTCKTLGWMIFGRLSKMPQKSQKRVKRKGLIQQNLGAQIIFIGKKVAQLLKIEKSTCESGKGNPEPQILTTIFRTFSGRITAQLLSGTASNFSSKTMFAPFASSRKLL